jgi:hypothetical protein
LKTAGNEAIFGMRSSAGTPEGRKPNSLGPGGRKLPLAVLVHPVHETVRFIWRGREKLQPVTKIVAAALVELWDQRLSVPMFGKPISVHFKRGTNAAGGKVGKLQSDKLVLLSRLDKRRMDSIPVNSYIRRLRRDPTVALGETAKSPDIRNQVVVIQSALVFQDHARKTSGVCVLRGSVPAKPANALKQKPQRVEVKAELLCGECFDVANRPLVYCNTADKDFLLGQDVDRLEPLGMAHISEMDSPFVIAPEIVTDSLPGCDDIVLMVRKGSYSRNNKPVRASLVWWRFEGKPFIPRLINENSKTVAHA